MNTKKIVIDGVTYNSVEEMPDEVRRNYEQAMREFKEMNVENLNGAVNDIQSIFADKNNNGTPDIFEGNQTIRIAGQTKFIVDGRTYDSLDELPVEARAKYEQAMSSMDQNRNGMPDIMEGTLNLSGKYVGPAIETTTFPADVQRSNSRMPTTPDSVITPDTSNGWMLTLGGLFLLMVCALGAIGVWYFFLR